MTNYRRGFKGKDWEKCWHWKEQCEAYPTINCIIQNERPSDEELCQRCQELGREQK